MHYIEATFWVTPPKPIHACIRGIRKRLHIPAPNQLQILKYENNRYLLGFKYSHPQKNRLLNNINAMEEHIPVQDINFAVLSYKPIITENFTEFDEPSPVEKKTERTSLKTAPIQLRTPELNPRKTKGISKKQYTCPCCKRTIGGLGNFKSHLLNKHPMLYEAMLKFPEPEPEVLFKKKAPSLPMNERSEYAQKISKSTKGIPKPKITCPICGKICGGQSNFNIHFQAKHE